MRINIGCGQTPTEGWQNFDNSFSARIAGWPGLASTLARARVMPAESREFSRIVAINKIRYANASKRIPGADRSVEVVYSSHMLEHLDRREVRTFLREVLRVLKPEGILRLAVPDLSRLADIYATSGDADDFVARTLLSQGRPAGLGPRVKLALIGPRHHLWMYDGASLIRLLTSAGFRDVKVLEAGSTTITAPGSLDLAERSDESVYVEAVSPG